MSQSQEKKTSPAMENVKKGLNRAADLTSLKFKLGQAKSKRKSAYTRLGELTYVTHNPRAKTSNQDVEAAVSATVHEISELNNLIVELEIRIKLLKAGG